MHFPLTKKGYFIITIGLLISILAIISVRLIEISYTRSNMLYLFVDDQWFTRDDMISYKYSIFTNRIEFTVESDSLNSNQQIKHIVTTGYLIIHNEYAVNQNWYPKISLSTSISGFGLMGDRYKIINNGVQLYQNGVLIATYIGDDYRINQVIE